jgi:hypothetical protein
MAGLRPAVIAQSRRVSSQSWMSSRCRAVSVRCPSSSVSLASTPGIWRESHSPWPKGTNRFWRPWSSSTGVRIESSSKPHGPSSARSSAHQPSEPVARPERVESTRYGSAGVAALTATVHGAPSRLSLTTHALLAAPLLRYGGSRSSGDRLAGASHFCEKEAAIPTAIPSAVSNRRRIGCCQASCGLTATTTNQTAVVIAVVTMYSG